MKILCLINLLLVSNLAFGQIKIDQKYFIDLLKNRQYKEVNDSAWVIRKMEYGKCEMIDYFIAKSLCGLGYEEKATEWYSKMLSFYKLKPESRTFIENEKKSCQPNIEVVASPNGIDLGTLTALANMALPESGARGKGGPIGFNCDMEPETFQSINSITEAEMESRLFYLDQEAEAIAKIQSVMGNEYQVKSNGRFIVVTNGAEELNNEDLKFVGESLENTFDFFLRKYKMRPPDKLLTVFLLPNTDELRFAAEKFHGISIPYTNLGYSNIGDLSLLGVADKEFMGTLMHELFHLMVRTDIGDAPPWLDEGIASIYEQSTWRGNELLGDVKNWRTNQLKVIFNDRELKEKVPSLSTFLESSWDEFDGLKQGDQCIGAINHAYARALMIFLQEKEKLSEVFLAMKNRTELSGNDLITTHNSVEMLEQAMGQEIDSIEEDFKYWLDSEILSN